MYIKQDTANHILNIIFFIKKKLRKERLFENMWINMEAEVTIVLLSSCGGTLVVNRTDKLFNYFERVYSEININVFRSSADPEVGRILEFFEAEGSSALNLDTGKVDIQLHDNMFRKSAIYEELAHALQYHRDGNVVVNSLEYYQREVEVAECMLDRVIKGRLKLSAEDIAQTNSNLLVYKDAVVNLGGSV